MKISIDDWHFRDRTDAPLVLDVFLDNGQHAVLEVNSMKDPTVVNGEIPEMIVFCELPGEKISGDDCPARWIARPPNRSCPWSNVQVPMALMEQIKARMQSAASAAPRPLPHLPLPHATGYSPARPPPSVSP
ncbi:MAG: hypothetical protein KJ072_16895 [Verrucomicrobia bacterium]|nr:hypothetical protein [Verrucomicrobiota bacterium]